MGFIHLSFSMAIWLLGAWVAVLHRKNKISEINLLFLSFGLILFLTLSILSRLENWESWLQYGFWTGFYFILFLLFLRYEKEIYLVRNYLIYRSLSWLGKISFSLFSSFSTLQTIWVHLPRFLG